MRHQDDGWRCGYYSLWYLWQAIRPGDTVDMADLQLPGMGSEFTTRVQQTVRDHHTQEIREVDQFLSGHGIQPPKSVKRGDITFGVRWHVDGAGTDKSSPAVLDHQTDHTNLLHTIQDWAP